MKFKELINKSIYKNGEVSSSRIFAYGMMMIIFLFGVTAITIEIINAVKAWKAGISYVIPTPHIVILGMWLAHQLTLLGIYKNAEGKPSNVVDTINSIENAVNENLPTEIPLDIKPLKPKADLPPNDSENV